MLRGTQPSKNANIYLACTCMLKAIFCQQLNPIRHHLFFQGEPGHGPRIYEPTKRITSLTPKAISSSPMPSPRKKSIPSTAPSTTPDSTDNLLTLSAPLRDPFRDLLVHPVLVWYLNQICGPGISPGQSTSPDRRSRWRRSQCPATGQQRTQRHGSGLLLSEPLPRLPRRARHLGTLRCQRGRRRRGPGSSRATKAM